MVRHEGFGEGRRREDGLDGSGVGGQAIVKGVETEVFAMGSSLLGGRKRISRGRGRQICWSLSSIILTPFRLSWQYQMAQSVVCRCRE
jgi:hypothetical protein